MSLITFTLETTNNNPKNDSEKLFSNFVETRFKFNLIDLIDVMTFSHGWG